MPGIIRKLTIFATVDGLILQPHGGWEHQLSLKVNFKTGSIRPHVKAEPQTSKRSPCLESHGIIGLLTIASYSYLLCITRREKVAQIFASPIYVIKDVAILPLSCQAEAEEAIGQARAGLQRAKTSQDSEAPSSTSEESGFEVSDEDSVADPAELRTSSDGMLQGDGGKQRTAGMLQNALEGKNPYGPFVSQWFSRRSWILDNRGMSTGMGPKAAHGDQKPHLGTHHSHSENDSLPTTSDAIHQHKGSAEPILARTLTGPAAVDMLPKTLRITKLLLTSRNFYFSYDFNITKRFGSSSMATLRSVSPEGQEQQYFWNRKLAMSFSKAGFSSAVVPIMEGFVGQQTFLIKDNSELNTVTEISNPSERILKVDRVKLGWKQQDRRPNRPGPFLLTLMSRRSVKRAGLRYLRRGIDDEGNCANSVETEQILSSPTWEDAVNIRSFVQIRSSIPLYFSQSPYAFKPVPILHYSPDINQKAFDRHFEELRRKYGSVHIVSLTDKHGGECRIGEEYEKFAKSNKVGEIHELGFDWFDFHAECRGMRFDNIQKLIGALDGTLDSFGETVIHGQTTKQTQTGIIRTNCMDCLDRTNVVQSALAQYMLQKDLENDGLQIDFVHDPSTKWFNTLWADNGDAISRQYASTAALKGDYTRTRRRDYRGVLQDIGLTVTRYYHNIINDNLSQTVIDVLLGNADPRIFDNFVATMTNADPGISIEKLREGAIDRCSKTVTQHLEETVIHGWATLSPAQTNTLRTLPLEEAILLLTNFSLYRCKSDLRNDKGVSFERIDLRSVTKIRYGTYITSTLTEAQMDKDLNVGLVIFYAPGKEDLEQVTTGSSQVSGNVRTDGKNNDNEESAILSWLPRGNPNPSQYMAMKIIVDRSLEKEETDSCPLAVAEGICNDIRRAITVRTGHGEDHLMDLVEKADIISQADARSRTGYLEQLSYSIKKLVWS